MATGGKGCPDVIRIPDLLIGNIVILQDDNHTSIIGNGNVIINLYKNFIEGGVTHVVPFKFLIVK